MLTFLVLLASSAAHATGLADGFFGLTWGPQDAMGHEPPALGCRVDPEPGAAWICRQELGGVPVSVGYAHQQGLFYGVVVAARGEAGCMSLSRVLVDARGEGRSFSASPGASPLDRMWAESGVYARLQFDGVACTVTGLHMPYYNKIVQRNEARVIKGAGRRAGGT